MRAVSLVVLVYLVPLSKPFQPRLLVIEEIQEQDMCAFKAFDEYLKDLATISNRALIVPDRYSFANLSSTSQPWQRCLRRYSQNDTHAMNASNGEQKPTGNVTTNVHYQNGWKSFEAGRVMLQQHARWPISQCDPVKHVHVRLSRCRRSAHQTMTRRFEGSGGCAGIPPGISNCSFGRSVRSGLQRMDHRCLMLNGLVPLARLLEAVPEFVDASTPCVTITHLARGVTVPSGLPSLRRSSSTAVVRTPSSATTTPILILCSSARWTPLKFKNEWLQRAETWLRAKNLIGTRAPAVSSTTPSHIPPVVESEANRSSYISAQFRTEKWPQQVASSQVCWRSIASALANAAEKQGVRTVFIATDALGSTSKTYAMKGTQKSVTRRAFKQEVLKGLSSRGLRVVMFKPLALAPSPEQANEPLSDSSTNNSRASASLAYPEMGEQELGEQADPLRKEPISGSPFSTRGGDLKPTGSLLARDGVSGGGGGGSSSGSDRRRRLEEEGSADAAGRSRNESERTSSSRSHGKSSKSSVWSVDHERHERAFMDLLLASKSKLFLHMYGTFGRGADALEGCEGARAGSCYGNWIVHTRDFRKRPSALLSAFA